MKKYQGILGIIFAILVSVLVLVFKDKIILFQSYGYLGLFFLNILGSATIFLPTPLFLTAFTAGSIYNPFFVALISSCGSAIGELTGYISGYGAEELIKNNIKINKVKRWMDNYGLWALFLLSAIPNPLFDTAGIIAGVAKLSIYKYLLVVWAGKFIKFLLIAYLGAHVLRVFSLENIF